MYIYIFGGRKGEEGHVNLNSHHITPNEPDINKKNKYLLGVSDNMGAARRERAHIYLLNTL